MKNWKSWLICFIIFCAALAFCIKKEITVKIYAEDSKEITFCTSEQDCLKRSVENGTASFVVKKNKMDKFKTDSEKGIKKIRIKGLFKYTVNDYKSGWYSISVFSKINFCRILFVLATLLFLAYCSKLPKNDKVKDKSIKNIEFLRFLFAMNIVLCHLQARLGIFHKNGISIEFFFILSGFLFAMTFREDVNVWEYIKKYIKKFYPMMILGVLVTGCFMDSVDFRRVIIELSFLSETGLAGYGINYPDWYLAVLLWISVFYLLSFQAFPKARNWIVFVMMVYGGGIYMRKIVLDQFPLQAGFPLSPMITRGFMGMGIGYFVYRLHTILNAKAFFLSNTAMGFIELFVLVFSQVYMQCKSFQENITLLCFALLLLLFVQRKGWVSDFFESRFSVFLGQYSLELFLLNCPIAMILVAQLRQAYPEYVNAHKMTVLIALTVLTTMLAAIGHHLVGNRVFFREKESK